jgi:hypothetical protein
MSTLPCPPTTPRSVPTIANQIGTLQPGSEPASGPGTCRRCGTPYVVTAPLWWRVLPAPVAAWARARGLGWKWQAACATCRG